MVYKLEFHLPYLCYPHCHNHLCKITTVADTTGELRAEVQHCHPPVLRVIL